ncbi:MAG: 4Fe-4S dicluster domain-containing protein [Eubacteriales bacterium]|nr:4Fe-4S dicluster domain-containing protein [Eubacteriales bacterium]
MLKITADKFPQMFGAINESMSLYLPVDRSDGKAEFKKWQEGDVWSDALNTERSAKDFFFPQSENLMKFKMEGKSIEVIDIRDENEDFVIFGARGCDVRSFDILDRVFLADPVDSFYKNRREHATVVSVACSRPAETCFCSSFGIDCTNPAGDVTLWREADAIYMEANTEKGDALLEKLSAFSEECDTKAVDAQKEKTAKILSKLPLKDLGTDAFGSGKTKEFFDSPLWSALSESCLGCGTCTFVCPTCQCYDIKEFNTGSEVIRYRCWDSCMYSDFTRMAHGNNRNSQVERFRQRFMHKLVYYPENNDGIFSCVGCGRCLSKCPISMNIVKVMKALGGNENA